MVLLTFLDDVEVESWDDIDAFVAIAREYSTLTMREIAGVTGFDTMHVATVSEPSDPPWTLSNPRDDGDITLRTWEED
jgi:hypothetical protein